MEENKIGDDERNILQFFQERKGLWLLRGDIAFMVSHPHDFVFINDSLQEFVRTGVLEVLTFQSENQIDSTLENFSSKKKDEILQLIQQNGSCQVFRLKEEKNSH